MIVIHFDFTTGKEFSYADGLKAKDGFVTHSFEFFTTDNPASDVIVMCKNGDYISRNELLAGDPWYTSKEIRLSHNIQKLLVAGHFKFKPRTNIVSYRSNLEFLIRLVLQSESPVITISKARELLGMATMSELTDWLDAK